MGDGIEQELAALRARVERLEERLSGFERAVGPKRARKLAALARANEKKAKTPKSAKSPPDEAAERAARAEALRRHYDEDPGDVE